LITGYPPVMASRVHTLLAQHEADRLRGAALAVFSAFRAALQGRAARYFSFLAKKSNQKKARLRRRPYRGALCCSGSRAGL